MNPAICGASEEEINRVLGGSLHNERRMLRFNSWLQETTNFKIIVKDEAMECPWVIIQSVKQYYRMNIYITRGVIVAHSTMMGFGRPLGAG